jgi:hypothetical protein
MLWKMDDGEPGCMRKMSVASAEVIPPPIALPY